MSKKITNKEREELISSLISPLTPQIKESNVLTAADKKVLGALLVLASETKAKETGHLYVSNETLLEASYIGSKSTLVAAVAHLERCGLIGKIQGKSWETGSKRIANEYFLHIEKWYQPITEEVNLLDSVRACLKGFQDKCTTIQSNTIQYNTIQNNSLQYISIPDNSDHDKLLQNNLLHDNTDHGNTVQYEESSNVESLDTEGENIDQDIKNSKNNFINILFNNNNRNMEELSTIKDSDVEVVDDQDNNNLSSFNSDNHVEPQAEVSVETRGLEGDTDTPIEDSFRNREVVDNLKQELLSRELNPEFPTDYLKHLNTCWTRTLETLKDLKEDRLVTYYECLHTLLTVASRYSGTLAPSSKEVEEIQGDYTGDLDLKGWLKKANSETNLRKKLFLFRVKHKQVKEELKRQLL